jgi:integrase
LPPLPIHRLSRSQIDATAPGPKPIRLYDGRGLYIEIMPNGSRWWRFKYRFANKEKRLSLGVYPEIPITDARERLDKARKLLYEGIDPSAQRKAAKAAALLGSGSTFEIIACEWFAMNSPRWVTGHSEKIKARLENDVYPWLGKRPIADITPPELLATVRRIESRGAIETAHRAMQNCSQVFRFAVATGRAPRDITVDLRGALRPSVARHHASITEPKAIGELLRAIQGYSGSLITKCALRLAPLVFVRPGELRQAEWVEINFEAAEWRIPAARMKGRRQHIVPLARQATEILQELRPATGHLRYVFPGEYHRRRPMSENTVNAALRRLGYTSDQMTGHGFRSMASTLLNEQGWDTEAIERQLAHVDGNSVKAAYNYAQHLPVRRKMMQAWADYLDSLCDPARVAQAAAAETLEGSHVDN